MLLYSANLNRVYIFEIVTVHRAWLYILISSDEQKEMLHSYSNESRLSLMNVIITMLNSVLLQLLTMVKRVYRQEEGDAVMIETCSSDKFQIDSDKDCC